MTLPGPGRRKKRRPLLRLMGFLLLAVVLYVGFFAAMALTHHYPLALSNAPVTSIRGAYHVHSTKSDGSGTPEQIAKDAKDAGLQFVIFTDHNQEKLDPPRYVDGVLLISAVEESTKSGHVVALGTSRGLTADERNGDVLAKIRELGGYPILSHPEQKKQPWTDWDRAPKAAGFELYSADSMFRTAQQEPLTVFAPAAAAWLTQPEHGLLTVVRQQPVLHERMLKLASQTDPQSPFVALCAHDAHGLPGYRPEFETLAMYLSGPKLDPDPVVAAKRVVDDLAQGRGWCGFQAIASADGFAIEGLSADDGRIAHPGEQLKVVLPAAKPPKVQVRVTGPATLLPDGQSVRIDGEGAVQIEVWAQVPGMYFQDGWKPWVVASPIRSVKLPPPPAAATDGGTPTAAGEAP